MTPTAEEIRWFKAHLEIVRSQEAAARETEKRRLEHMETPGCSFCNMKRKEGGADAGVITFTELHPMDYSKEILSYAVCVRCMDKAKKFLERKKK